MKYLLLAFVLLALVAACAQQPSVICNKPYMLKGTECCLDSDSNAVCDVEQGANATQCPTLDCSKCAATVVERNVTKTITKYVCKDGTTVDSAAGCDTAKPSPFANYKPVLSNSSSILAYGVRPA